MKFTPKSDKQIAEENLMPAGVYPFQVTTAENKFSKAGNEMIALELRVFTPDGRTRLLNDYLMEKVIYKLAHFCKVVGLAEEYAAGTVQAEDCVGREGFVKVSIKSDKTGQYPDQNSAQDYLSSDKVEPKPGSEGAVPYAKPTKAGALTPSQLTNEGPGEDVPW